MEDFIKALKTVQSLDCNAIADFVERAAASLQKMVDGVLELDYNTIADALELAERQARADAALWGGEAVPADEAEACAKTAEELLQKAEKIKATAQAVARLRRLVGR